MHGIGLIMPGKGAIVVQAMSNGIARFTGFQMIMNNVPAVSIIQKLREPAFDPEDQQYAVLCLYDNNIPQTYTGTKNHGYAGVLTAPGISVQGNTLTGPEVIKAAFDAAVKAKKDSLPLEEILMKALQAGANAGGDKRCGERRASSAFLTVSKPDYLEKHWLEIIVTQKDDHTAAVQQLKKELDNWKLVQKDKALRVPDKASQACFISSSSCGRELRADRQFYHFHQSIRNFSGSSMANRLSQIRHNSRQHLTSLVGTAAGSPKFSCCQFTRDALCLFFIANFLPQAGNHP